jgi:two-component system nitrate/nitrite response regulator NarL
VRGVEHVYLDEFGSGLSVESSQTNGEKVELRTLRTARVLVVDDYEPWRRFVCSALLRKPELEIIGEVADGLDAVHKAEELHPDLILLAVGLPTLNGIQTARLLRRACPASRILFVSQESSPDVVSEALSTGAQGYVVKASASDLLTGVADALA